MGLGVNVFSIYQPEIIRLNQFTDAQGSWITTTRSLFILAALLCVNQLCARVGLRLVMTLGVFLVGAGCLCFACAGSFSVYCLAAALTGVGYCWAGMVPLSMAVGSDTLYMVMAPIFGNMAIAFGGTMMAGAAARARPTGADGIDIVDIASRETHKICSFPSWFCST